MVAVYTDGQAKMKLIFRQLSGNLWDFFDAQYLISGNYPEIRGTDKSSYITFGVTG